MFQNSSQTIGDDWQLTFSLLFFAETLFVSTARKSKACQIEFCTESNIFSFFDNHLWTHGNRFFANFSILSSSFCGALRSSVGLHSVQGGKGWNILVGRIFSFCHRFCQILQSRKVFQEKIALRWSVQLYFSRTAKRSAWEAGCWDVQLCTLRRSAHDWTVCG